MTYIFRSECRYVGYVFAFSTAFRHASKTRFLSWKRAIAMPIISLVNISITVAVYKNHPLYLIYVKSLPQTTLGRIGQSNLYIFISCSSALPSSFFMRGLRARFLYGLMVYFFITLKILFRFSLSAIAIRLWP